MAWTTPGTWSDGTKVTGTFMNQQVRDNFNALDQHGHSGSAGDGATTLGDLTYITFIDAAAPSAPGGTLTRIFTTGTALAWRSGAAGTTNVVAASVHEHTLTSVQSLIVHNAAGTNAALNVTKDHDATGSAGTSVAVGGTGKRTVTVVGGASIGYQTGSVRLIAKRDSTEIATFNSGALTDSGTAVSRVFIVAAFDTAVASGTYTYSVEFTGSGFNAIIGKFISAREVRVL